MVFVVETIRIYVMVSIVFFSRELNYMGTIECDL